MQIVNKHGIPELIFKFLKKDFYDHEAAKGTLSATTLLKPVQEIVLTERYWDKIEVEADEQVWKLFGSGVHKALENSFAGDAEIVSEERLYGEIAGERISGKFDIVYGGMLTDFKVTSAWTLVYGSRVDEWRRQLSIYRWLYLASKAMELKDVGRIIAVLRDWSAKDASRTSGNYPASPVMQLDFGLLSFRSIKRFMEAKVKMIKRNRREADEHLRRCRPAEMWYNARTKKHNKCEKYCVAAPFCHQWRSVQASRLRGGEGEPNTCPGGYLGEPRLGRVISGLSAFPDYSYEVPLVPRSAARTASEAISREVADMICPNPAELTPEEWANIERATNEAHQRLEHAWATEHTSPISLRYLQDAWQRIDISNAEANPLYDPQVEPTEGTDERER